MQVTARCTHCESPLALRSDSTNPLRCPRCRLETRFESIGPFWLLEQLGEGGYGKVYRGYEPALEREVAVKILHDRHRSGSAGDDRFDREAKLTANITHPHVAPVFSYGKDGERLYLVSALIHGRELRHYIGRGGFADLPQAVRYAVTLLETLAEVHQRYRTWHRDVKPSNIMIAESGMIYLLDFGIAASQDLPRLTVYGKAIGTPGYMAPEQFSGQLDQIGPWSDQYSMGIVLYQMLTGRLPFETPQQIDLYEQILKMPPAPPSTYRAEIDPTLDAIVLRAIQKAPIHRFRDCLEFAAALQSWLDAGPGGSGGGDAGGRSDLPVKLLLGSLAALLLVGVLALALRGSKTSSSALPPFRGKDAVQPK